MKLSERDFQRNKAKYLATLAKDPADFGARNDLGLLLWNAGKRKDAFEVFLESAQRHPNNPTALSNLAFAFLRAGAIEQARSLYQAALQLDPAHADAKRGLAATLAQSGSNLQELQQVAGAGEAVTVVPYRGKATPISLLLLVSLGSGNVHIEKLADDRTFAVTKLVVELFDSSMPLPDHDLIFNAIGDAESCAEALRAAQQLVASESRVLNAPRNVLETTRIANAQRLRGLAGVRTATTLAVSRQALIERGQTLLAAGGLSLPVLLRSPGHHTGHHFVRVDHEQQLAAAARDLPGEELYAMEFIDVRNADGKIRKYRVMFVDGKLYPLHLAVSQDWKVHYFSAQMADYPEHRAEDQAFLEDMQGVLGDRAVRALENIASTLALDYAGIDFALTPDGEVVVFEANATMVIVEPEANERWDYRREPVRRVVHAVRSMLRKESGR